MKKLAIFYLTLMCTIINIYAQEMVDVNRWVSPVTTDFTSIPANKGTDAQITSWGYTNKIFQYRAYLTPPTTGSNLAIVNRWEMPNCKEFIIIAEHEISDQKMMEFGYKNKQFIFYAYRTRPKGAFVAVNRWTNALPQGSPCRDFTLSEAEYEHTDAQLTSFGYSSKMVQFYVPDPRGGSNSTTINVNSWRTALNRVFSQTCVRLNNYTPVQNQYDRNERQFFKPNDSYIQLNFNGSPLRYNIPIDVMQVGPDKMFKMYVNDWNSRQLTAAPENGRIKVTLVMEDDGTEIVGNCYNNGACGFVSTPNFNYRNSRIDIYLQLANENGRLSYNATTSFNADVVETGPCVNNLFAFLCPNDRAGLIKSNIEAKLNEHLNSSAVKTLMGQVLTNLLPAGTTVNGVSMNAQGDIVIR